MTKKQYDYKEKTKSERREIKKKKRKEKQDSGKFVKLLHSIIIEKARKIEEEKAKKK